MADYHIAQLNVARIVAPLESEIMHGFTSRLNEINALGAQSEGFVWQLLDDDNNSTSFRIDDSDDKLITNLTVWESIDALHTFTYKTLHAKIMKNRHQWFEKMTEAYLVLWWVPAGHQPTLEEAYNRLKYLREHGATPKAFTFAKRFMPETV